MDMNLKKSLASPRGLLLMLDVIVVFLFLLSIMQPFLLQTWLMRLHAHERSMDDARVSLLMQISQQLYNTAATLHLGANNLGSQNDYSQVGYYDSNWNHNQRDALPSLASLNLSGAAPDLPPVDPQPDERICLSRLMITESGGVRALWICDK